MFLVEQLAQSAGDSKVQDSARQIRNLQFLAIMACKYLDISPTMQELIFGIRK